MIVDLAVPARGMMRTSTASHQQKTVQVARDELMINCDI